MVAALIADPTELSFDGQTLWCRGQRVDLVYNRLTDFAFDEPGHGGLRAAYLADAVVVTPHPRAHALYADKGNLAALCDDPWLQAIGVPAAERALLRGACPRRRWSPGTTPAPSGRRAANGSSSRAPPGSRAAYRGDKLTRRVFDEIAQGGYIAQALVRPSERRVLIDGDSAQSQARPAQLRLPRPRSACLGAPLPGADDQLPHARRRFRRGLCGALRSNSSRPVATDRRTRRWPTLILLRGRDHLLV